MNAADLLVGGFLTTTTKVFFCDQRVISVYSMSVDQFDIDACGVKTLGGLLDFFCHTSWLAAFWGPAGIRKLTQMIEQGVNEVPI